MSESFGIVMPKRTLITDLGWSGPVASGGGPGTTWNPADFSAGGGSGAFSNSNRTVTCTDGNHFLNGRSVAAAVSNQKVYVEHHIDVMTFSWTLGFSTIATVLAGAGSLPGSTTPSTAFYLLVNGIFHCDDSVNAGASITSSAAAGDGVDCAFDTGAGKAWFRVRGLAWNDQLAGTQDPATGQGGVAIPFAGPYYAIYGGDVQSPDAITSAFASADWARSAPNLFTPLAP